MTEQISFIPARLKNAAVNGHVAGAEDIIDDDKNKTQKQINREVEESLGTGGSVDSRIASAVATEATRAQTAEEQLRQAYEALSQSQPIPVTELPATGEAGKIYRLAGTTSYADYMYAEGALTTPIKMAEYDNAIDDEPTAGSNNLVKSGGVVLVLDEMRYGEGGKYDCLTNNNNTVIPFNIVANHTYILFNYSTSGAIALFSQSQSSGGEIETFIGNLTPGTSITIKATQDAPYVRCFHNITYGAGKFGVFDISNSLEERFLNNETNISNIEKRLFNQSSNFYFYVGNVNRVVEYNIQKGHEYVIEYTGDGNIALWTYSQSTYPEGTKIEIIDGNLGSGVKIRFRAHKNASYIYGYHADYTHAGSFTIYDANSIEQMSEDGVNPPVKTDVLFWGDSLTQGAGSTSGNAYPNVCMRTLGNEYTYINCGVGGETANTIAARQGGNSVVIPAGAVNGDYIVLKDIFGAEIHPLLQGDGGHSAEKIYIGDSLCSISWDGSKYTISGYDGETKKYAMEGRFIGSTYTSKIAVIFVGTNGAFVNGSALVEDLIAIIDSMIGHLGHDRFVVLGLSRGTEAARSELEYKCLKKYGNKYFNTRKMLVDYGLEMESITPTTQDEEDIAVGSVPSSLRVDDTHLNDFGYDALGTMLADKIKSLGYLDAIWK